MAKVEESTLLVQLELQNRSLLTEIESWSIDSDYLTVTDGFEFTCYSDKLAEVRGLEMQPVELKVNGHSQLLGRIDRSEIGSNGQAISYSGRDYIADAVECSVDPNVTISEEMTLATALVTAAGPIGISRIIGDEDLTLSDIRSGKSKSSKKRGSKVTSKKVSEFTPEYGEQILSFASRLVSRHGATIQPADSRDTWLLSTPDYEQAARYSVRRTLTGDNSNIISGTATRDFSNFPTFSIYNGVQAKPASAGVASYAQLGVGIPPEIALLTTGDAAAGLLAYSLFNQPQEVKRKPQPRSTIRSTRTTEVGAGFAPAAEDIILGACHIGRRRPNDGPGDPLKLYRLMAVRDEKSKTQEELDRLAAREVGDRLKELLVYECTVQGHVDPVSGAVWSVDTMVDVVDEVCDVAETMWIARRTLKYDSTNGATTTMVCWRPGAFLT